MEMRCQLHDTEHKSKLNWLDNNGSAPKCFYDQTFYKTSIWSVSPGQTSWLTFKELLHVIAALPLPVSPQVFNTV